MRIRLMTAVMSLICVFLRLQKFINRLALAELIKSTVPTLPLFIEGVRRSREGVPSKARSSGDKRNGGGNKSRNQKPPAKLPEPFNKNNLFVRFP